MADGADPLHLRAMETGDWLDVARIFGQGIETGDATFEAEVPDRDEWDEAHVDACRLVAELDGEVVGFAALTPVSGRCVYAGVAEVSVYVGEGARGGGVGTRLLEALVAASEEEGYWTLQAGIFPENEASIRLHQRCGFRVVGVREALGELDGRWRDVVLMERRSGEVGV